MDDKWILTQAKEEGARMRPLSRVRKRRSQTELVTHPGQGQPKHRLVELQQRQEPKEEATGYLVD